MEGQVDLLIFRFYEAAALLGLGITLGVIFLLFAVVFLDRIKAKKEKELKFNCHIPTSLE